MKKALENESKTNEVMKKKSGAALAKARGSYLWSKYVMNNKELKAKIKMDFDHLKSENNQVNKTPVLKETFSESLVTGDIDEEEEGEL